MRKIIAIVFLGLCLTACTAEEEPTPTPTPEVTLSPEEQEIEDAKDTVNDYFQVKSDFTKPFKTKIEEQEKFLTDPNVHPEATYKESGAVVSGLRDVEIDLTIENVVREDDKIKMDYTVKRKTMSQALQFDEDDKNFERPMPDPDSEAQELTTEESGEVVLVKKDSAWRIESFSSN